MSQKDKLDALISKAIQNKWNMFGLEKIRDLREKYIVRYINDNEDKVKELLK